MTDSTDRQKDKTASAFKTISEVSKELDVPQHVLRFWENKFPQISPLKRRGGRRYYRPEDVRKIEAVKKLLYDEGYTIKGAVKLFSKKPEEVQAVVEQGAAAAPQPAKTKPVAKPVAEVKAGLDDAASRQLNDALHYLYDARKRLNEAA